MIALLLHNALLLRKPALNYAGFLWLSAQFVFSAGFVASATKSAVFSAGFPAGKSA